MSSVNVAELRSGLVKAKHLIREPHMWGKGEKSFHDNVKKIDGTICAVGPVCAMGAVAVAFTGHGSPVADTLRAALPHGWVSVPDYNDATTTTHADVLALFDRAISALDIHEFLSIANEAEKPLVNLTDALNLAWELYGVDE